jgi:hypothetical protein
MQFWKNPDSRMQNPEKLINHDEYTLFMESCGSGLSLRASDPMTWVQIPAAPSIP